MEQMSLSTRAEKIRQAARYENAPHDSWGSNDTHLAFAFMFKVYVVVLKVTETKDLWREVFPPTPEQYRDAVMLGETFEVDPLNTIVIVHLGNHFAAVLPREGKDSVCKCM